MAATKSCIATTPTCVDSVEVHEGPKYNLTHWLISTQTPTMRPAGASRAPSAGAAVACVEINRYVDNSSLSHFSVMTHVAIEQAARRWH